MSRKPQTSPATETRRPGAVRAAQQRQAALRAGTAATSGPLLSGPDVTELDPSLLGWDDDEEDDDATLIAPTCASEPASRRALLNASQPVERRPLS